MRVSPKGILFAMCLLHFQSSFNIKDKGRLFEFEEFSLDFLYTELADRSPGTTFQELLLTN